MSCDVCEVTESLWNELWHRWSELILQTFRHFTYVTAHSPTLPSLYLRHSSFSNPSVASPTPQPILQPFLRFSYITSFTTLPSLLLRHRLFTYVTARSPTSPLLHLSHSSFSNLSFACPTSQALHLRQSSFSNPSVLQLRHSSFSSPSFASPTSHALHLRHLASRP